MKVELSGHYGYGRIIRTMLPMVMMVIVTSIYSIIDGYFVSNFAGCTAFASMNLVWPVISLMSAIGMMIGSGGSALVSKTLGEGGEDRARKTFTMLIHLSVCAGIVCVIVGLIFMRPIAIALGAEGEMIDLASNYGRIVVIAMPAFIVQNEFQSFFMPAENAIAMHEQRLFLTVRNKGRKQRRISFQTN